MYNFYHYNFFLIFLLHIIFIFNFLIYTFYLYIFYFLFLNIIFLFIFYYLFFFLFIFLLHLLLLFFTPYTPCHLFRPPHSSGLTSPSGEGTKPAPHLQPTTQLEAPVPPWSGEKAKPRSLPTPRGTPNTSLNTAPLLPPGTSGKYPPPQGCKPLSPDWLTVRGDRFQFVSVT